LKEIDYIKKHLKKWMKPNKKKSPIFFPMSKNYELYEPLGVVLILAPWNYPFNLSILPLIGAIAAGNCVIVKPSEISSNTASVIQELINKVFGNDYIEVVQGGAEVAQNLLVEKFDYIFYTGGENVGREVMKAAAEHLTPVTLELGGKSPCIVDKSADDLKAAARIVWGKFINAGQTCVAPDYLFVHKDIKDYFLLLLKDNIEKFFGEKTADSKDYGRIINRKHFRRLEKLLEQGEKFCGGKVDEERLFIPPTVLKDLPEDAKIMKEEIFGPILPVFTYDHIDDAIDFINERPKPLALYLFSQDKEMEAKVLQETSSGGVCLNDVILQLASLELPFGGVGHSGFGRYHGKASFTTFSNNKAVFRQTNLFDLKFRYPPATEKKMKIVKKFLK
jgi:aldehyde dehydrogenase (NAD+)